LVTFSTPRISSALRLWRFELVARVGVGVVGGTVVWWRFLVVVVVVGRWRFTCAGWYVRFVRTADEIARRLRRLILK
jgi:hypothetical protein